MINTTPNETALRFFEVVMKAAQELDSDTLMYWSRNEELLLKELQTKDIQFLTEVTEGIRTVPAFPEKTLNELWKKGVLWKLHQGQIPTDFHLKQSYPKTDEQQIVPYELACYLHLGEIKNYIDSDISQCKLTLQQVEFLMSNQSMKGKPGPLSFQKNNYVLVETVDDPITPFLVFRKKSERASSDSLRGSWQLWRRGSDKYLLSGNLLLAL